MTQKQPCFTINDIIELPQQGSWPPSKHLLEEKAAYALEMALAINKPLLIKGEPGIGKSQLARAAAVKLERILISHVVNINCEGQELLWHYDPVARLNDAQALRNANDNQQDMTQNLHPENYLNPGILWWGLNWSSAERQYEKCRHKLYRPETEQTSNPSNGVVILIDEIDKADASLPNTLLEALGNGGFQVPIINQTVRYENLEENSRPLVIITSNDERELPPAFLRRCLVLNLTIDEPELVPWLVERGEVHFPDNPSKAIKVAAAGLLQKDRHIAGLEGLVKPGQAEYLDLLKALKELTQAVEADNRDVEQTKWLEKIKDFALAKATQR